MNGNDYNNSSSGSSSISSTVVIIHKIDENWIVHSPIFLHELKLYILDSPFAFYFTLSHFVRSFVRLLACIHICSQMIRRINMPFAYKIQWIFTVNFDQMIEEEKNERNREVTHSSLLARSPARSLNRMQSTMFTNKYGDLKAWHSCHTLI